MNHETNQQYSLFNNIYGIYLAISKEFFYPVTCLAVSSYTHTKVQI